MGIFDDEICRKASFKKDYEFNDFQFACLVFYIEKYFNVNISPEDYIHFLQMILQDGKINGKQVLSEKSIISF